MRTAKTKKKRTTDEVCDQIANDIAEGVSTARYSRQQLLDCIASQQDALCAEVQKLAVVRSKAVAFAVEVVAEAFPTHQLPLTSDGSRATPKDDWRQRVLAEHKDLHAKVVKMERFLDGDAAKVVGPVDLGLLRDQLSAMHQYRSALSKRIARFR